MFYILQNESTAARRRVPILLTDSATGTTAQSGVALTNIYAYVNINGGAFIGGTGSVGEAGFGQYYYQFEANEVATLGLAGIHITAASCRDYDAITQIAAFDLYSASAGGGISAYDVWNYTNTVSGNVTELDLANASQYAQSADSNANAANNQTVNIAAQVWGDDLAAGGNAPYAAGTAGTILYDLSLGGGGITAGDVWSYVDRTITGGIADTVQLVSTPVDVTTASMSGIANTVWDFVITGFGQTGSAAVYSTQTLFTAGNIESYVASQTPQDVWTYSGIEGRTITGGLADTVTTLTNRAGFSITGGTITTVSDKTGYSLSASQTFDLTGNITGNVSGSVGSVTNPVDITTTSMTGIAGTVWNSLTASYTANDTFGKTVLRSDAGNATGNVTLRSAGGINMVDADIHRIDNDVDAATNLKNALTGIGTSWTGNIVGSVDSVVNPVDVSTSSMSGIANTVWSTDVSGYASPSAGYDLSNAAAGGGITAGDVWSYVLSNASSAEQTLVDVKVDTTQILSDISGLPGQTASDVWNYTLADTNTAETDLISAASGGAGISAADVWNYGSRTITGGIADTVVNPVNLSNTALYNTAYAVWSGNAATYETSNSAFGVLATTQNQSANTLDRVSGVGATVWEYATRTLTTGGAGISAADIWSYGTRTITGGIADTVTTVTNRSGFAVTGGTINTVSGNVNGSVGSVVGNLGGNVVGNVNGTVQSVVQDVGLSVGTQASIAEYVWIEPIRTITGGVATTVGEVTGNIAGNVLGNVNGSVNSVTNNVSLSLGTYGGIATSVWNADTRTLTSTGAGISAYDVWNFVLSDTNTAEADLVSAASGGAGISAADVWSYGSRTITGGLADTVTTLTNRSGFAVTGGTIDTVNNGVTVSTNNDKTGYALSAGGVTAVQSGLSTLTQAQVGTEVDSSLSDVGLTSTVTGRIDVAVSSRLASASYTAPPTEAAIAGTVWSYGSRTLTSTGTGISAYDVWNFGTRTLTSGAGITVNAATNIINGPYFVKSNVDSQDNTLDVIRGMVQDIQLTVTDAFGNPFDTTALGLLVNFYDQAGTLTTSYGTTELYGPAGLVQFTLDTAVTANEGRYNLILSAAGSGNTIKFGPLQTLVRPF